MTAGAVMTKRSEIDTPADIVVEIQRPQNRFFAMNLARFDSVCQGLPGAKMVVQWHGTHVFKIGEKMFAFANVAAGVPYFVFKTAPLSFEILLEQGIAIRAPYLPRGHWVRVTGTRAMKDADLASYLKQSYEIVLAGLSKPTRAALGLGGRG